MNGPFADEAALILAARGGSRSAFVDLVRMHQAPVRMYIGSHVSDRSLADDIAQETFISAFRSLGEFQGDSPLRTWLLGIARHRTLDEFRRQISAKKLGVLERALGERAIELLEADAAHVAQRDEELQALHDCLAQLPQRSAKLVTEHYFSARSLVQMAQEAGQKQSSLRVELFRARQALRRCIDRKLSPQGGV